jgi:hypothetical protein
MVEADSGGNDYVLLGALVGTLGGLFVVVLLVAGCFMWRNSMRRSSSICAWRCPAASQPHDASVAQADEPPPPVVVGVAAQGTA